MNRRSFFKQAALFVAGCTFGVRAATEEFAPYALCAFEIPVKETSMGWGSSRITYKLIDGRWHLPTQKGYKKMSAAEQREKFKAVAQWKYDRLLGKPLPFYDHIKTNIP